MDTASATTAMDTVTVIDTMESAKDPPKPLPNPDTTHTAMLIPVSSDITLTVIPLILDTDTLTITARGLLSPLLLPNPDTDTTVTITARDPLSPPLSPDTHTMLMPPILMPTVATMVISTKFCCLTISRLCHTKIGEL